MSRKANRLRARLENERRGHLAKQKRLAAETAEMVRRAQDDARLAKRMAERMEALRIYVEPEPRAGYGCGTSTMMVTIRFDPDAFDFSFRYSPLGRGPEVHNVGHACRCVARDLADKVERALFKYITEPESREEMGRFSKASKKGA